MASDSSGRFRRGISHFFTATKNTIERVEEKKNKQTNKMDLVQFQAQEREFCDDFAELSVHLQTIVGVYLPWNFYKNY